VVEHRAAAYENVAPVGRAVACSATPIRVQVHPGVIDVPSPGLKVPQ
jgi:hypothetical protein